MYYGNLKITAQDAGAHDYELEAHTVVIVWNRHTGVELHRSWYVRGEGTTLQRLHAWGQHDPLAQVASDGDLQSVKANLPVSRHMVQYVGNPDRYRLGDEGEIVTIAPMMPVSRIVYPCED